MQAEERFIWVKIGPSCLVSQTGYISQRQRVQERNNRQQYIYQNRGNDLLIVLVYVDDIIFGCNKDQLVQWFSSAMESEFEISMIGELSFFLGL
jgi:hypothetical protein